MARPTWQANGRYLIAVLAAQTCCQAKILGPDRRVHPHLLRQSIAVHFPRGGADIQHVQDFSGHADKEVRFTAVRAIGRLGGPADIPVLLAMYEQDKDIQPEFSYAEALKNLGEHQVSRQLQAILDARPRWGYARNPRVAIVGHIARSGLRQMPLTIHLERR